MWYGSPAMARWVAIDHGTKRIGVAAGTDGLGIASPLAVIEAEPQDRAIQTILELVEEYRADGLVVGWPLNMDDSEGPQGRLARAMAAALATASKLDVRLWDERLSSFAAKETLAGRLSRQKAKARRDAVAAAIVLQDFFSAGGPESAPRPDEIPTQKP